MSLRNCDELAVLELMIREPTSYFPPIPKAIAEELSRRGLAVFHNNRWYPTANGVAVTGRTLH